MTYFAYSTLPLIQNKQMKLLLNSEKLLNKLMPLLENSNII